MSFLNPWGLLGLLGIPILILIYILRPKFEEKVVTSTFIWKLSLKYRKKNMPLQWLRRSLLFILQLLIIVVGSLMLARPVIHTDAVRQQVVILDASASMMTTVDGKSNFENAISELKAQIKKLPDGSSMTIIVMTEDSDVVIKDESSKRALTNAVEAINCTYQEGNRDAAVAEAETLLSENSLADLTIYTDSDWNLTVESDQESDQESENTSDRVQLVNVSQGGWNAAVLSLDAAETTTSTYTFTSKIACYGNSSSLTAALYVDDQYVDSQIVEVEADESVSVEWATDLTEYNKVELYLEAEDNLAADNEFVLYQEDNQSYQALVVSETPTFIKSILDVIGNFEVTVVSSLDDTELAGYDLYVFDGIMPDTMPDNGAVWIFAPTEVPDGLALTIESSVTGSFYLEKSADTSGAGAIGTAITAENIAISSYTPLVSQDDLQTVFLCNNEAVLLAGEIDHMRTVICGFDIHDANLPLLIEYPQLIYNMGAYTLPQMLDEYVYNVGETAQIQAVSSSQLISVAQMETMADQSNQAEQTIASYYTFPAEYTLVQPGIYQISQTLEDGSTVTQEFFVHISADESNLTAESPDVTISIQSTTSDASATLEETEAAEKAEEGTTGSIQNESQGYQKELWLYLAIILFILVLVEWEVQYHEQL